MGTWHQHPAVRTGKQLTVGERCADWIRNGMGSWVFVLSALGFLALWMFSNGGGVDIFPWILLNLILSCLAAMQGAILLIAAKRQDQISSELALNDYEVNKAAKLQLDQQDTILKLTKELLDTVHANTVLIQEHIQQTAGKVAQ